MNKINSYINHETCKKCLNCGEVCPNLLIEKDTNNLVVFVSEYNNLCINCGHCMAVCPTNSIHINNIEYDKSIIPLKKNGVDSENFYSILNSRRAIRKYKDKKVPKELLEKITDSISKAPISFTPNHLEINIISSKEILKKSLDLLTDFYKKLVKMLDNPISKYFIKKNVNEETFMTLTKDIHPLFKYKLPLIENTDIDPFFRKAPVVFIIHANKKVGNHTEDGLIALTYGILAAQSMKLGTCPVSLIPPAINKTKELKKLFKIPNNNEVISSFIVGYPKFNYKKTIKRNLKNVEYL